MWMFYILLVCRKYIVPLGVFDCFAAGQECLSQIHQVDQLGKGHIQTCGLQGCVSVMGQTQKQAGHELRDNGKSTPVGMLHSLLEWGEKKPPPKYKLLIM